MYSQLHFGEIKGQQHRLDCNYQLSSSEARSGKKTFAGQCGSILRLLGWSWLTPAHGCQELGLVLMFVRLTQITTLKLRRQGNGRYVVCGTMYDREWPLLLSSRNWKGAKSSFLKNTLRFLVEYGIIHLQSSIFTSKNSEAKLRSLLRVLWNGIVLYFQISESATLPAHDSQGITLP